MPALRENKRLADAERALANARAAEAAFELVTAQQDMARGFRRSLA